MHSSNTDQFVLQLRPDGETSITRIVYESFGDVSRADQGQTVVSPSQVISDVVCSYHGCYESDRYSYDLAYVLTFSAASVCTFIQGQKVQEL